jgi:hypothetical protein
MAGREANMPACAAALEDEATLPGRGPKGPAIGLRLTERCSLIDVSADSLKLRELKHAHSPPDADGRPSF